MPYKAYAGVGSRETPDDILYMMTGFANLAEDLGWTLRSGGADRADKAFEAGVKESLHKEIYLPWGAFNGNKSMRTHPSATAITMAEKLLGADHWANLSQGARKLHARNIHEVLGANLIDPAKFLICWTKDGKEIGGTATALKVARMYHVPIFNLGGPVDEARLEAILNQ